MIISNLKRGEIFSINGGTCDCYCKPNNNNMGHVLNELICEKLCQVKNNNECSICVPISKWDFASFVTSRLFVPSEASLDKQIMSYKKLQ